MTPTDHWKKAEICLFQAEYHIDNSSPDSVEWKQLMDSLQRVTEKAFRRQPKALRRLPILDDPGEFIE